MPDKKRDYKVGRGKPPKHTQFRPGESGNPKGRPRKKRPTLGQQEIKDAFVRALQQPARIKSGDVFKEIPAYEAVIRRLVSKAASGDNRAIKLLFDYIEQNATRNDASAPATWLDLMLSVEEEQKQERLRNQEP